MWGIQEILLLIILVLVVLLLSGRRGKGQSGQRPRDPLVVPGRMRLYLVASLLWLVLMAVLLEPWQGSLLSFLYYGVGPVGLAWAIGWVVAGYKEKKR